MSYCIMWVYVISLSSLLLDWTDELAVFYFILLHGEWSLYCHRNVNMTQHSWNEQLIFILYISCVCGGEEVKRTRYWNLCPRLRILHMRPLFPSYVSGKCEYYTHKTFRGNTQNISHSSTNGLMNNIYAKLSFKIQSHLYRVWHKQLYI